MLHVERATFSVELKSKEIQGRDIEYYIEAKAGNGNDLHYPVTAPNINNSVLVLKP